MVRSFYDVLQVERCATLDEIKLAFKKRAGAKRPSIWCTMHLRPWLTQRRGENTTAALRLGARPHVTRPVDTKTKQLRGANHPTQPKHQRQNYVSSSRPSFWVEFTICWETCPEMSEMMWSSKIFHQNSDWFWRSGWWIQRTHQLNQHLSGQELLKTWFQRGIRWRHHWPCHW